MKKFTYDVLLNSERTKTFPDSFDNEKKRNSHVDFIVKLHNHFNLVPETLFLTTHLFDSCIEKWTPDHNFPYELLLITAFWIACKYEETKCIIHTATQLHNTFPKFKINDFLKMEINILATIKFNFEEPSIFTFLSIYTDGCKVNENYVFIVQFASYIAEKSLYKLCFVQKKPSIVASSIIHFVQSHLKFSWTNQFLPVEDATIQDQIQDLLLNTKSSSLDKKYSQKRFGNIPAYINNNFLKTN